MHQQPFSKNQLTKVIGNRPKNGPAAFISPLQWPRLAAVGIGAVLRNSPSALPMRCGGLLEWRGVCGGRPPAPQWHPLSVVMGPVRAAQMQNLNTHHLVLDQRMFSWASYVFGQDIDEVWWPTDLVWLADINEGQSTEKQHLYVEQPGNGPI
jgi:hypothetical protein